MNLQDLGVDSSLTIPQNTETMLAAGGIILLSIIIVSIIIFKTKWHASMLPLFIGLLAYGVVFVAVQIITGFITVVPSVDIAVENNTQMLVALQTLLLAAGMVLARYAALKIVTTKHKQHGDIMMVGAGIGLGDGLMYGLTAISDYVMCTAFRVDGLEGVINGMAEADYKSMALLFDQLTRSPSFLWLLMGLSVLVVYLSQIILIEPAYGVVKKELEPYWNVVTFVGYALVTMAFKLYDYKSVVQIEISFFVLLVFAVGLFYYVRKGTFGKIEYETKVENGDLSVGKNLKKHIK